MTDASAVGAQVKKQPALVTYITVKGGRQRVKLVFFHHHFDLKVRDKMELTELLKQPNLLEPGEITTAATLPPLVASIKCFGGTVRYWPRGVTVARLVEWPLLEEVEQGDGSRRDPERVIAVGYSVCSEGDNYERAVGRHFALENLLHSGVLQGIQIEEVAKCYAGRVPRKRKVRKVRPAAPPRVEENIDPGDEIGG